MFQNGRMFNGGCSDKEYNRLVLKTIGYGTFGFLCFLSFLMTVQRLYWLYIICAAIIIPCCIYIRFFQKKQPPKEEEKE